MTCRSTEGLEVFSVSIAWCGGMCVIPGSSVLLLEEHSLIRCHRKLCHTYIYIFFFTLRSNSSNIFPCFNFKNCISLVLFTSLCDVSKGI